MIISNVMKILWALNYSLFILLGIVNKIIRDETNSKYLNNINFFIYMNRLAKKNKK